MADCRCVFTKLCLAALVILALAYVSWLIASIVIGIVNWSECPIEPKVPLFLVVFGSATLASLILSACASRSQTLTPLSLSLWMARIFLIVWGALGCVWFYGIYGRVEFWPGENYCDSTLYYFALVFVVIIAFMLCSVALSGTVALAFALYLFIRSLVKKQQ